MTGVLLRDSREDKDTDKKAMGRQRQRLELCNQKERPQSPEAGWEKEGILPAIAFRGISALLIPWTSNLQNYEPINVCGRNPPNLWWSVTAALENEYRQYLVQLNIYIPCEL